jgi:hypothetical protein
MKKTLLIVLAFAMVAFADVKLDFLISARRLGCETIQWVENDYVSGVKWKHYAKVACKENQRMPVRIVGLKFLDVATNLKGEYIFTYGDE